MRLDDEELIRGVKTLLLQAVAERRHDFPGRRAADLCLQLGGCRLSTVPFSFTVYPSANDPYYDLHIGDKHPDNSRVIFRSTANQLFRFMRSFFSSMFSAALIFPAPVPLFPDYSRPIPRVTNIPAAHTKRSLPTRRST